VVNLFVVYLCCGINQPHYIMEKYTLSSAKLNTIMNALQHGYIDMQEFMEMYELNIITYFIENHKN